MFSFVEVKPRIDVAQSHKTKGKSHVAPPASLQLQEADRTQSSNFNGAIVRTAWVLNSMDIDENN